MEIVARHEAALKRTARRFSLDPEDAEDAYQRSLEILLTKAPTTDPRQLIRWTQTVIRHEAIALRESRERLLARHAPRHGREGRPEPLAQIAARADGPAEQAQRREAVARGREALRTLKPAELRALTLLAEGYSYAEIGQLTGFSRTKVNRVLTSGRDRFRAVVAGSEDGSRCRELRPLLSAFCDGEASAAEQRTVREHLRACASCRATMRAYREAPRIAIALTPVLAAWRSLLGRVHDLLSGAGSKLSAAKLATLGAATAGGAALATGVVPAPPDLAPHQEREPAIVRGIERGAVTTKAEGQPPRAAKRRRRAKASPRPGREARARSSAAPTAVEAPAPAEFELPPSEAPEAPPPEPAPPTSGAEGSGSAAGEFGP